MRTAGRARTDRRWASSRPRARSAASSGTSRSRCPTAPGARPRQSLIEGLLLPGVRNDALAALGDAGAVSAGGDRLAMTTDSFVVKPIRFPGGSIGELAVNGTVNDLAVSGARPLALSLALVLEEGLAADELRAEVEATARGRPRRPASRS